MSKAAAAAEITKSLLDSQVTEHILKLSAGTLNGMIGIANRTQYGLRHKEQKLWQATYAGKPGIPHYILPHDTTSDDNVIPLQNQGFNGVFGMIAYEFCTVDAKDPAKKRFWKPTDQIMAVGCLVYSTAFGNSKFYVKSFSVKEWDKTTWNGRFTEMDEESNGFVPNHVTFADGIFCAITSYFDDSGGHRTMVMDIELDD